MDDGTIGRLRAVTDRLFEGVPVATFELDSNKIDDLATTHEISDKRRLQETLRGLAGYYVNNLTGPKVTKEIARSVDAAAKSLKNSSIDEIGIVLPCELKVIDRIRERAQADKESPTLLERPMKFYMDHAEPALRRLWKRSGKEKKFTTSQETPYILFATKAIALVEQQILGEELITKTTLPNEFAKKQRNHKRETQPKDRQ